MIQMVTVQLPDRSVDLGVMRHSLVPPRMAFVVNQESMQHFFDGYEGFGLVLLLRPEQEVTPQIVESATDAVRRLDEMGAVA